MLAAQFSQSELSFVYSQHCFVNHPILIPIGREGGQNVMRCRVARLMLTKAAGRHVVGIKNDPVGRLRGVRDHRGGAGSSSLDDTSLQVMRGKDRSLAKASASALAHGHSRWRRQRRPA